MRFLLPLFIIIPIAEMWLLIKVGTKIGALPTVALVFLTAAIGLALLRQQGLDTLLRVNRRMEEGQIPAKEIFEGLLLAIGGALLLFLIPVNLARREFLLDWKTAVTIPWDIIILFGGGFALARGFSESGLTAWLAGLLGVLQGANVVLIIAAVVMLVIFLTEVTSNTATASLLLPVMAALAAAIEVHPFGLMVAAVIAASFAFMLPAATPPNAIVYGSHRVSIQQMAGAGLWLNLLAVVLVTGFVCLLLPRVWNLDLQDAAGLIP